MRNSQELARPIPFFGLFHDLLELRTELASEKGGEDGRDTKTAESSDISEQTLFLECEPGTLGLRPFRVET